MNALPATGVVTARPAASSWAVPNRAPTVLHSLRSHRWLAACIATLVGLIGLIAAFRYGHATYEAEAIIRVSPSSGTPLGGADYRYNSEQGYRDFAQQQVFEIGSYSTAMDSLNRLGPMRAIWQVPGESDRHAAERLMSQLKIEPLPDSYFITTSLTGESPKGLAELVNAVVNTYLARETAQELNGADAGVQMLNSRKGELEQQVASDSEQLNQLAQSLQIATFAGDLANPYDKLLGDENAALARAHRAELAAEARVLVLKASQAHIKDLEVDSKAQDMLTHDTVTTTAKQQLLQEREAASVELHGLGPSHPARPALEQKVADINHELDRLDQSSLDKFRASLNTSEGDKSGVTLAQAEANLDQAHRTEDGMQKDLDALRANAATFGAKYGQAVALHDKLERERKGLQDVADQASLLRIQSRAPGFVSLEAAAMTPDIPMKGRRRIIFSVFIFVGLILAVGVPTGLDLIDPRIRAAAELEGILGFPPLGAVVLGGDRKGREGLRRIALGILRERRTSGVRTYVLTPVREGAGTTTLALALAQELSGLGVPSATIETTPAPAAPDGEGPRRGRRGSRNGAESRIVRRTGDLTQHIAATGALDGGSHALITAKDQLPGRFTICQHNGSAGLALDCVKESVEHALQTHEIVLLDAPPLLTSADAVLLMQMPVGAILVVRGGRDQVREITSAMREIERLAPPVVGTVLNTFFADGEGGKLFSDDAGWQAA
jgi:uncharacterized protein involved in exopolysaccharide biosynthesis